MINLRLALVLVLASTSIALAAPPPASQPTDPAATSQPAAVPADWVPVDAGGKFKLLMPADMKEQKVRGIDSFVTRYRSETILLNCDYGWYSDPLADPNKPKHQKASVVVGGKAAIIVTYESPDSNSDGPFVAAIHFPDVTGDKRTRLTVFAQCKDAKSQQVAKQILQTITFAEKDESAAVDGLKVTLCLAPEVLAYSDECRANKPAGQIHPCAGDCRGNCQGRFQMCWECAANAGLCQVCGKNKLPAGTFGIKAFKAGETVALGVCLENTSAEKMRICNYMLNPWKLKWSAIGPDAESVLFVRTNVNFSLAAITEANFPELAPGGKRMFAVNLAGNPPCIDQTVLKTYLLKPGDYKISAAYSNQEDTYFDRQKNQKVQPAGKVWKGAVTTGSLAIKITGEFHPAPPSPFIKRP